MPTATFQTPLVEKSIKAKYKLIAGDEALKWCGINTVLCVVFALRLGGYFISSIVELSPDHILYGQYLEISLSVVCGVSAICDVITYVSSRKFKEDLTALSPTQSLLLNIRSLARPVVKICENTPNKAINTSMLSSPEHNSCHSAPVTPHLLVSNQPTREPFTPPLSTSLNPNSNMTLSTSNMTLSTSFQSNSSFHSISSNMSFSTPARDGDSNYHFSASPKIRKRVSDLNNLSEYLKEYEEKEKWLSRGSSDRSLAGGWAPRPTETLPPRPYFLATQNQIVSVSGDTSYYNQQAADALLERLGVSPHSLDVWTENIRKWISQTIFQHIHREIKTINKTLDQVGSAECKIGSVSTAVLSKVSTTKHEHISNIALLLPYLEVSVNQEYLVHRMGELASGSCVGSFRWESGGKYKNSLWNKELPTDSQIVMHCISTYLDSHLPRNPMYPEGRTFTTQYFVQTPIKAETKKKEYALFQSSIHPPHFKLLVGDEVWEVSKGRNNLFHTLILLLYYLREEQHGMLGPVNLGPTGLNMTWIIS